MKTEQKIKELGIKLPELSTPNICKIRKGRRWIHLL